MIYVGIDPGAAWCGFAALNVGKHSIRAAAATYGRDDRSLTSIVRTLLPFAHTDEITVIAEDFQIRSVGHQRFNRGDTLRLLGALEYESLSAGWSWNLIAPGSWKDELPKLFGNELIADYKQRWPLRGHANWDHCLSAWRVLGRFFLGNKLSVMSELRRNKRDGTPYWSVTEAWVHAPARGYDLIAPAVRHKISN